jgi:hypothetical protein
MTKVNKSFELSPFEHFQLEKYGNILTKSGKHFTPSGDTGEPESGSEEAERFSEWFAREHEQQLIDFTRNF